MTEGELYPNATPTAEWGLTDSTHHGAIDEDRGSPDVNDSIWCNNVTLGTDLFDFPNTIDDVDEVTAIEVNLYYYSANADENPSGTCVVDINLGGWQGTKSLSKPHDYGWEAFTWTGLSGSQADLDGLQVKVLSSGLGAGKYIPDAFIIYTLVVDVTYTSTAPTGWSHKISGILNANIAKINGIPIANIAKVNGV